MTKLNNEDGNIEYKETLTNRLKREIVSFLNSERGGIIYLGIKDDTKEKISISQKTRHEWEEKITNWVNTAFYPIPYSLIEVLPNEPVFTIKVRSGRNRPYAIAKNGFDSSGVYVRDGSSAVKATNERIRRMQQMYGINDEFDSKSSPNQSLTFNAVQKIFNNLTRNFNAKSLQLISNDTYNNAALLISDQNPYIVKVAVYDGNNVMRFRDKREFQGPITKQIDDILSYLKLINRTSATITGKGQRQEQKDYPNTALRESLINALVHRDYMLSSNVKIELFDNRAEILSPGGIPDGLTLDDIKGGLTAARNPRLIHILDKMKYIENYGTGIRRIMESYDSSNSSPEFIVRSNFFKVSLPNLNYKSPKRSIFSKDIKFSTNEIKVITVLKKHVNPLKRIEIENFTGLSFNQIVFTLKKLRNKNIIIVTGSSVNTKYQLRK